MTNVKDLQKQAKALKIKGWFKMKRAELEKAITTALHAIPDDVPDDENFEIDLNELVEDEAKKDEAKKAKKKSNTVEDLGGINENLLIKLKDLIKDTKLTEKEARKKLRKAGIEKPYTKWGFHSTLHQKLIEQAKKALLK